MCGFIENTALSIHVVILSESDSNYIFFVHPNESMKRHPVAIETLSVSPGLNHHVDQPWSFKDKLTRLCVSLSAAFTSHWQRCQALIEGYIVKADNSNIATHVGIVGLALTATPEITPVTATDCKIRVLTVSHILTKYGTCITISSLLNKTIY